MYKIRDDRPLSAVTIAILSMLHRIAERHQTAYFVIGATARDILMTHVFGIESGRATRDVDFAIALERWDQFELVKEAFVAGGDFQRAQDKVHRLYYRSDEFGAAFPLDLIPFGKIEDEGHKLRWPPDMAVVMNVAGYAEALGSAIRVDVGSDLVTPVISLPSLAALKLLAWNDRGLRDNRGALDLFFLLKNYHDAGNADRLYGEGYALLEKASFNIQEAGAALLGYDARLILAPDTCQDLLDILGEPQKFERLVVHMDRTDMGSATRPATFLNQFEYGLRLESL